MLAVLLGSDRTIQLFVELQDVRTQRWRHSRKIFVGELVNQLGVYLICQPVLAGDRLSSDVEVDVGRLHDPRTLGRKECPIPVESHIETLEEQGFTVRSWSTEAKSSERADLRH